MKFLLCLVLILFYLFHNTKAQSFLNGTCKPSSWTATVKIPQSQCQSISDIVTIKNRIYMLCFTGNSLNLVSTDRSMNNFAVHVTGLQGFPSMTADPCYNVLYLSAFVPGHPGIIRYSIDSNFESTTSNTMSIGTNTVSYDSVNDILYCGLSSSGIWRRTFTHDLTRSVEEILAVPYSQVDYVLGINATAFIYYVNKDFSAAGTHMLSNGVTTLLYDNSKMPYSRIPVLDVVNRRFYVGSYQNKIILAYDLNTNTLSTIYSGCAVIRTSLDTGNNILYGSCYDSTGTSVVAIDLDKVWNGRVLSTTFASASRVVYSGTTLNWYAEYQSDTNTIIAGNSNGASLINVDSCSGNSIPTLISHCSTPPIPTTVIPSTPIPTTVIPTTPIPTTVVPTTPIPTTVVPTTPIPTTVIPTTPIPTTVIPTTPIPTTVIPTIPVATTRIPTTQIPTVVPTTPKPTTTAIPITPLPSTPVPTVMIMPTVFNDSSLAFTETDTSSSQTQMNYGIIFVVVFLLFLLVLFVYIIPRCYTRRNVHIMSRGAQYTVI